MLQPPRGRVRRQRLPGASCSDTCSDSFLEFYADCSAKLLAASAGNAATMSASFERMVTDCAGGSGEAGEVANTLLSDHINTCTNVAVDRTATQSSVRSGGGEPDRAVDGDTNGVFSGNSCTHTDASQKGEQWWQVDLGSVQTVRAVQVTNRADWCAPDIVTPGVRLIALFAL